MKIFGMQKTTLVDYPGHVATTLFTAGCNFRCPYCHNGDLVLGSDDLEAYSDEQIFSHLQKRIGLIDAVVISGGEPTLQSDLPEFIRRIKDLGYLVKLDTNGSHPAMLRSLVEEKLIDYVAMDIKHSRAKYHTIASLDFNLDDIVASVEYLKQGNIPYEFRTTLCKELHQETDITAIGLWLSSAMSYYLQPYRETDQVIQPGFHAHSKETLTDYVNILSAFIPKVEIRGLD